MSRKEEPFGDVIRSLNLIPVSISYEYDPCDSAKARELYIRATTGSYTKTPGEDDVSIALGITGYKGRVHVNFAPPITNSSMTPSNWPLKWTGRSSAAIACSRCTTWRTRNGATLTRALQYRQRPQCLRPTNSNAPEMNGKVAWQACRASTALT